MSRRFEPDVCPICGGTGDALMSSDESRSPCTICGGSGRISDPKQREYVLGMVGAKCGESDHRRLKAENDKETPS